MLLATNFVGAAFSVVIDNAEEGEPRISPDLGLTTTEVFDPGFKFVNVYFVVVTETSKASLTKMSYALAPTTGFHETSADR
jgi:hypothetical protein